MINTAYIERLNATFRQRLACLFRRTCHLARHQMTLQNSSISSAVFITFAIFTKVCVVRASFRVRYWARADKLS
jgi:hypothetical protein